MACTSIRIIGHDCNLGSAATGSPPPRGTAERSDLQIDQSETPIVHAGSLDVEPRAVNERQVVLAQAAVDPTV